MFLPYGMGFFLLVDWEGNMSFRVNWLVRLVLCLNVILLTSCKKHEKKNQEVPSVVPQSVSRTAPQPAANKPTADLFEAPSTIGVAAPPASLKTIVCISDTPNGIVVGVPHDLDRQTAHRSLVTIKGNPDQDEWYAFMPVADDRKGTMRFSERREFTNLPRAEKKNSPKTAAYMYHGTYEILDPTQNTGWVLRDRWVVSTKQSETGTCNVIARAYYPKQSSQLFFGPDAPDTFSICIDMGQGTEQGVDGIFDLFQTDCRYRKDYRPGWEAPDRPVEYTCRDDPQKLPDLSELKRTDPTHPCINPALEPHPTTWWKHK